MDILMSIFNKWADMIFAGEKPFEFRKSIGKNIQRGTKVYLYETAKNGGSKKVVGEFTIRQIHQIQKAKLGAYNFLPYYCKEVIKDMDAYDAVMEVYQIPTPNYDNSFRLSYIYNSKYLEDFLITHKFPNLGLYNGSKFTEYLENKRKCTKLVEDCDTWLRKIGYYDDYDESYYRYYIEIENPIRYDTPLELNDFLNAKGQEIEYPPQSWYYCSIKPQ